MTHVARTTRRTFVLVLLLSFGLWLAPADAQAPRQTKTPIRVLFIGNSYTFYNNLGDLVSGIAASRRDGPAIEARLATVPVVDLAWHLEGGPAMSALAAGPWDFVVLQEQSLLGGSVVDGKPKVADPPTKFYLTVRNWVARIREKGAKPILLMTWARRDNPGDMQKDLAKGYNTIGQELGVTVAPVGLAWQEARWRLRTLEFHFRDGAHPSEFGSYLSAAVVYATLTGHDPRGAAPVIQGHPVRDDGVVDTARIVPLAELGPATAAALQQIAWETVMSEGAVQATAAAK